MRIAASSGVTLRVVRPSALFAETAAFSPPNAPKSTFAKERFMAFDMRIDKMKPLAPSRAPATIKMLLPIAKPVALAARPAYEFRRETTTGMSAPPIGSTRVTPITRASTVITANMIKPESPPDPPDWVTTSAMYKPTALKKTAALMSF